MNLYVEVVTLLVYSLQNAHCLLLVEVDFAYDVFIV
jgi:hypothetical protein